MSLAVKILKARSEAIHAAAAAEEVKADARDEQARRAARIRWGALWVKWRMIEVGPDQYAFLDRDSDDIRVPDHGAFTLDEAEQFVRTRERERGWK